MMASKYSVITADRTVNRGDVEDHFVIASSYFERSIVSFIEMNDIRRCVLVSFL
jgi:hypothetical protein